MGMYLYMIYIHIYQYKPVCIKLEIFYFLCCLYDFAYLFLNTSFGLIKKIPSLKSEFIKTFNFIDMKLFILDHLTENLRI